MLYEKKAHQRIHSGNSWGAGLLYYILLFGAVVSLQLLKDGKNEIIKQSTLPSIEIKKNLNCTRLLNDIPFLLLR